MIEPEEDLLGRVVISNMGRDKKRPFLVIGILDAEHVLLADGILRKCGKPKKKKRGHIRVERAFAADIRATLLKGTKVSDAEIRKCLTELGYEQD